MMRIDKLPGKAVAVPDLMEALSQTWTPKGTQQQSEASHASQMTLVVFSGAQAKTDTDASVLPVLSAFSKNYPCRILWVLLDEQEPDPWSVKTKLQTYSHLGANTGKSCCEIILLSCSPELDRQFLTGLLSTCIHTDLPVYFWMQGLGAQHISCLPRDIHPRCAVFDSSAQPDLKALIKKELPHIENIKDLAYARSLPTRQAIGQFLSTYDPLTLIKDLESVTVEHHAHKSGEAYHTLAWVRHCIHACAQQSETPLGSIAFKQTLTPSDAPSDLKLFFEYGADKFFQWACNDSQALAVLGAKLDASTQGYPLPLRPVAPEWALADALFF